MERKYVSSGENPYTYSLTKLEYNILSLLQTGMTNKEIAEKLGTTWKTVKSRLVTVYQKIGARNRAEAAILFYAVISKSDCTTTGGNNDGPNVSHNPYQVGKEDK